MSTDTQPLTADLAWQRYQESIEAIFLAGTEPSSRFMAAYAAGALMNGVPEEQRAMPMSKLVPLQFDRGFIWDRIERAFRAGWALGEEADGGV